MSLIVSWMQWSFANGETFTHNCFLIEFCHLLALPIWCVKWTPWILKNPLISRVLIIISLSYWFKQTTHSISLACISQVRSQVPSAIPTTSSLSITCFNFNKTKAELKAFQLSNLISKAYDLSVVITQRPKRELRLTDQTKVEMCIGRIKKC